ncbi:Crp/Fnr family transcriptional regulator [Chitinophaga sp. LS1]|uniref:Crp/Fnr family transcriptional regulator n=1 Tax=Chitinophaga sp. LS1 TaxID=3051176 RepID=UPI002AAAFAA1|nr:Crp/Fnr family transcriptional regulator [Chitinophaga sp. LS1]WPV67062.1 Crp/Fnr family transcriptional regulator [Chitinophaga sp. LS1]
MEEIKEEQFRKGIHQFYPVSETDFQEIWSHCRIVKLKRNDFFLKEGQLCNKIAFINSGMIRHFYTTNANDVTRWVSMPGEFTSSLRSFLRQAFSIENLQAVADCELFVINKDSTDLLLKTNESFKGFWIRCLEYSYLTIEDRVYSLIEKSAEERFMWMVKNQPWFIQLVPVMYTASMLGITPRHLSRLRKKFKL